MRTIFTLLFSLTAIPAHAYNNDYKSPDEIESMQFKARVQVEQVEYDAKQAMDKLKREIQFERDMEQIRSKRY